MNKIAIIKYVFRQFKIYSKLDIDIDDCSTDDDNNSFTFNIIPNVNNINANIINNKMNIFSGKYVLFKNLICDDGTSQDGPVVECAGDWDNSCVNQIIKEMNNERNMKMSREATTTIFKSRRKLKTADILIILIIIISVLILIFK